MIVFSHSKDGWDWNSNVETCSETNRGTLALELPAKETLTTLFTAHGTQTIMNIGFSRVNDCDQYDRKTGRELSTSRLLLQVVALKSIEIRGIKHIFHFELKAPSLLRSSKDPQVIKFGLSTIAETNEVKLVYSHFGVKDE